MATVRQGTATLRTLGRVAAPARTSRTFASATKGLGASHASDMETSSLTGKVPDEATVKAFESGIIEGRQQQLKLPHARYQYHPPRYYRGPLHPVQSPPSSDPTARDFVPGPFNFPRLRQTYESTVAPDLMTLTYLHTIPGEPQAPLRNRLRYWDGSSPYHKNRPRRGPRGGDNLALEERNIDWQNVPRITGVSINAHVPRAEDDKDYLWVSWAALQAVTGVIPTITKAREGVSLWGTKKRGLAGVKASIYGDQAYEFVDKCLNLVFPRIKDWPGLKGSTGDDNGNLGFGLSGAHFSLFPEIEVNYDMYPPKLIPGVNVSIQTTATSDRQARLLLQAMGVPFYGKYVD